MILHSIISPSDIFYNSEQESEIPVCKRIEGGFVELRRGRLSRLISTDPKMYLDGRYEPGSVFRGHSG